jgi:4-amino-4-deoxy-L-arabinose transferase-like glycosyltransferase
MAICETSRALPSDSAATPQARRLACGLGMGDYGLLALFCIVLFGHALIVGGPLTMHEGVLSQTSRAMFTDGDFLVPKLGEGPWLERPPLPQWITVGVASVLGRCDAEWIVRIGPLLAGTATVLIAGGLAGAWFGRAIGLLSGLILASMYQFTRYSTLAEADVFLSPIVAGAIALFVRIEARAAAIPNKRVSFLGARPWLVLAFFVLVGMTNLAKGLVFGTVMALVPVGAFLLWNAELTAIRRYVWLWGWLVALAVAVAWPLAVYQRYPDALELWHFDLFGRLRGHYLEEPAWYYAVQLLWVLLPWTPLAFAGLWMTRRQAFGERGSPARLLWCWAILPGAVFSLAQGKHHHYLIHSMAPWAIVAALAAVRAWERAAEWPAWLRRPVVVAAVFGLLGDVTLLFVAPKLPGEPWMLAAVLIAWPLFVFALNWSVNQRSARTAAVGCFSLLAALYWVGFAYKAAYLHKSHDDTIFLAQALAQADPSKPLLLNLDEESLEGLRILFYLDNRARGLHNLTFLLDERIHAQDVYVITRYKHRPELEHFGKSTLVVQSQKSRRETGADDRWTLFRVALDPNLPRRPGGIRISPMQAMYREKGPYLE